MASIKTSFSDNAKKVNVKIHKNFLKDGDFSYAKVSRNTANAENLIAVITENSSTKIDEGYLYYCAKLFKEAILKKLKEGSAVNIFDIGTLYINACGNIEGRNPDSTKIPKFSVGFTPSEEAKRAVQDVKISETLLSDSSPTINTFTDLFTAKTGTQITRGKSMQINGAKLKVAGEGSGIFFVPATENGAANEDEKTWIKVPLLSRNLPSELQFFLPDELEMGKSYFVAIKTFASHGSKTIKTLRQSISSVAVEII